MSDSLLDKLQSLDTILGEVRKRYHSHYTELKTLKAKPQVDVAQVNQLKLQLAEINNAKRSVGQERDELQQQLTALTKTHQALSETHTMLVNKHKTLEQEVKALRQLTTSLQEKNRAAAASTKVVLERLAQIDNTIE